jgi:hypothetical protein
MSNHKISVTSVYLLFYFYFFLKYEHCMCGGGMTCCEQSTPRADCEPRT